MNLCRRLVALSVLVGLGACSAPSGSILPPDATRQTQGTPQALPGTPQALPGGTPQALPGIALGCNLVFQQDQANCTIAINITIPAINLSSLPASLIPGLHPADLQNAYSLPSRSGGGTVAIVDAYDDPAADLDLTVYRAAFGLPPCLSLTGCFRKIDQQGRTGSYPLPSPGWDQEISLDLDMVSAACPNCKIVLVEANSNSLDDLGAAVDTAAALHPAAISNSYYGPEWADEIAEDTHFNHPGVAITVSAGDQDSTFYPAASPYVTAVGGTTLRGGSGTWSESAWAYTGQGCSLYETKPEWQGDNGCQGARSTVDVAAVADPQTGVAMFDSTAGGWLVAGGTSVGAPLVAAAYALSGNPQGPAYSYAHASAFHDVAPAGYDLPTGLGSPDGVLGL